MSALASVSALRRRLALGAAALVFATAIVPVAHAGGPLQIVNAAPVVYANGGTSIVLNVDQGPYGARSNAQAAALVQNAIDLWNGVGTATMRLAIGQPLATDYNPTNYSGIFNSYFDGLNPVIFDSDGSIIESLFGTGAKSNILGFAGSAYWTSGSQAGKYIEGRAVLNGYRYVSDAVLTTVLAHEFGHFFGLSHAQIDATQGVSQANTVLMYPVAYRTAPGLHEDDVAAVTSLYPSPSAASVYGQLNGTFTTNAGAPILGANIWARETTTGKVYSVVSDFLMQGNGFLRMLLPAGTYTLNAESVDSRFVAGSGVGPYANSSTDASFRAPHPITPIALGGASPKPITITPGCLATVSFRLDGSGGVTGNCGSSFAPPAAATTTLASSLNPAPVGLLLNLTATVTGASPTGTVNFSDSGVTIAGCAAVPLAAGKASCATAALVVGVHSIAAVYSGDAANASATSAALSQVIKTVTTNVPPTANFSYTTTGMTANFTDASTDSDGSIVARTWDFGDGTTSSAINPIKTYSTSGTRNVTLTVTDNTGATASTTKPVTVSSPARTSNVLTNGVPVTGLSAAADTELAYTMVVPAGATRLKFTLSGGTGNANLYVRFGSAPTTSSYDCRSNKGGNGENCAIAKSQAGTYYVMVRSGSAFSGATLTGSYK